MEELLNILADKNFLVSPEFNGQFLRFPRGHGNEENPNGWFIGREIRVKDQALLVATFGDFRTGEKYQWTSMDARDLSPDEKRQVEEAMKRHKEANRKDQEEEEKRIAALVARDLPQALKTGESAYLQNKGLGGSLYGCVLDADDGVTLIVPLSDVSGTPWSVQFISPDGQKRYLKGGRKRGLFHLIPRAGDQPLRAIYICEGLATGASIHLATNGQPVACAMDAGNLLLVAQAIRTRHPKLELVLCGDEDLWTRRPDSAPWNPGREAATAAAKAIGARVVFPRFANLQDRPTDFNDLHQREGLDVVREQLTSSAPELNGPAAELNAPPSAASVPEVRGPEAARVEGSGELPNLLTFDKRNNPVLPTQLQVAMALLGHFQGRLIKQDRELFAYDSTHWRRLETRDTDLLKQQIQTVCGGQAGTRFIRDCFEMLMVEAPAVPGKTDLFAPNAWAANFQNGTLWIVRNPDHSYRLEFRAHRRQDFLVNVLPYNYDPESTAVNPEFERMLVRVFEGDPDLADKLRAVAQMYGACLLPFFPRLFLLWGPPKTGKSTLINIAARLVAPENTASVPPNDFQGFSMESLAGKLVNIDTDIPVREPIQDDVVKKIIERRPFRIRRKGVKDLMAPIPAVHIFGSNAIPPSYEASTAHERRWTFIHCRRVVDDLGAYTGDYWDFIYEQCPEGILNFALSGLRDLIQGRGQFCSPASSREAMGEWHRESNPVAAFLHDVAQGEEMPGQNQLVIVPGAKIKRQTLWETFEAWAEHGDIRISFLGKYRFYKAVRSEGFEEKILDGVHLFSGIGLRASVDAQF